MDLHSKKGKMESDVSFFPIYFASELIHFFLTVPAPELRNKSGKCTLVFEAKVGDGRSVSDGRDSMGSV